MFTGLLTGYFLYVAVGFLIVPFLIVYVLEDLAGRRSGNRDGFLGAKVWLTFLMSVSGQVFFAGVAFLLALWLEEKSFQLDPESTTWKTAWGLIVGGLLASICPFVLYRRFRIPDDGPAAILRKAMGINGFVTGTVFTISLVVTVVLFFQNAENGSGIAAAIAIVYAVATFILGELLSRHSEDKGWENVEEDPADS